jgi:hypothetical protein
LEEEGMVMVRTSTQKMQKSWSDVFQWAEENSMRINIGKTETMNFTKGGNLKMETSSVARNGYES